MLLTTRLRHAGALDIAIAVGSCELAGASMEGTGKTHSRIVPMKFSKRKSSICVLLTVDELGLGPSYGSRSYAWVSLNSRYQDR